MKIKKIDNDNKISSVDTISIKDENDILIESLNDNTSINSISHLNTFLSGRKKIIKENKLKSLLKAPLIILFFFLILIFGFIITLIYFIFYFTSKENFTIVDLDWIVSDKNDRKYQDYLFNNGLEILLVQDKLFDRDGASIVIENGYMDNPEEEGIASFATYLLNDILTYGGGEIYKNFYDYFGDYRFGIDDNFINFSFEILNNGFKKFFYYFSLILEPKKISDKYDEYKIYIIKEIHNQYLYNLRNIFNKESHLLEYLVYGLKDDNNEDILPEGNQDIFFQYDDDYIKKRVLNYIDDLIDPSNIKIAIFSKYKFLISAKYMKKYFHYLITKKKKKKEENKYIIKDLKKSQIFYIKGEYHNQNFIEIIYYIDKVKNESFSELVYKANYLYYIMDFINEKKNGSLYYLLTNNYNFNIKSISSMYEISFKSVIELEIFIELNCLENLNDIIFIIYQYMHKIIKEAIGENLQMKRYLELKNQFDQDAKYRDKTFETVNLVRNNARQLFLTRYKRKYFFYNGFTPWDDNDKDNENIIRKESSLYFEQIKPENSVIVLGLKDGDINKITCNNNSKFFLNCSHFQDEKNVKSTKYYEIEYIKEEFNASDFEQYLDTIEANLTFEKNTFMSKHNESFIGIKEEEDKNLTKLDNETFFHKFFFKRNTKFKLPRVYISLYLFHPYLRPLLKDKNKTRCYYFKIIEFFNAIKRKISEDLGNAIRAGNEIQISDNENNLVINIFCYEDVAYEIIKTIKTIIFDKDWELTDFISNNEMYKIDTFQDYFTFNRLFEFGSISHYYFFSKLKNHLYNKYEFFPQEFEKEYYQECINSFDHNEFKNIKTFIINGYIYGYYTKEKAQKISNLFKTNNTIDDFNYILKKVNNTEVLDDNPETFTNWIKEIKKLEESDSVAINPKTYNRQCYDCYNNGVAYIKFDESELEVSLIQSILQITGTKEPIMDFTMFKYGDIFYVLLFRTKNIREKIPNDYLLNFSWYETLENIYAYNDDVDNIGNRYYYVKKNFNLTLFKKQTSLLQRAYDEIKEYSYKGTVLDPVKIMNLYNDKYKNKDFDNKELNRTISSFLNILKRKRFYVYTVAE